MCTRLLTHLFGLIATLLTFEAGRADVIPNDPYYSTNQWALQTMHVPAAWDYSMGDPSVTIAVLDTGIIFNTPELQGRFLTPLNGMTSGFPEASATNPHGTWVASTIAMPINNLIGGAGT